MANGWYGNQMCVLVQAKRLSVPDCDNSGVLTMELPQAATKP